MAFDQFTRCLEPSRFVPRSIALQAAQSAILAGLGLPLAIGHPICLIILGEIFFLAWIIAYCRNWLFERLLCLDGERDVIGLVVHISPPPGVFARDWDNDYSINLLLQNTEFGVTQAVAQESVPYGELIKPQAVITAEQPRTPGYDPDGYQVEDEATNTLSATLHAEFEGAGNFNLMQVSQGVLGVAVGAFLLCLIAPFPIDLILAIFVFIAGAVGGIVSKFVRPGSPSDANKDVPTLHKGVDVVYLQGTWVYDSLHEGWNEIHPIKRCCLVGCWKGDWTDIECNEESEPTPPDIILLRLRKGFQEAQTAETLANQTLPEHQWQFHPDLDGCARDIIG